jgi:hypothetical protein
VAATEIGQSLGVITRSTAAAFVTAGLLSALLFPLVADALVRADRRVSAQSPA